MHVSSPSSDVPPPSYDEENFTREYERALNRELEKEPIVEEGEVESEISPTTASPFYKSDSVIPPTATSGYACESVLLKGLQVPTRFSYVSSGFKYPQVLEHASVTKEQWSVFTQEVKQHARMSASQWMTTVGAGLGTFVIGELVIGFFGLIPAVIVGHKMRKHKEEQNFKMASRNGELAQCVSTWNENYFKARKLVIRVDIPGDVSDMASMDVSTTKAFDKRFTKCGSKRDHQSYCHRIREVRARRRAGLRGRIVIIPLDAIMSGSTSPSDQEKAAAKSIHALQKDGPGLERGVATEEGEKKLTPSGQD